MCLALLQEVQVQAVFASGARIETDLIHFDLLFLLVLVSLVRVLLCCRSLRGRLEGLVSLLVGKWGFRRRLWVGRRARTRRRRGRRLLGIVRIHPWRGM
jgi:hypothetical protein